MFDEFDPALDDTLFVEVLDLWRAGTIELSGEWENRADEDEPGINLTVRAWLPLADLSARSIGLLRGTHELAEKERRSGSARTVQSYSRMLRYFFGKLGKPPDEVAPGDVLDARLELFAGGHSFYATDPSALPRIMQFLKGEGDSKAASDDRGQA